VLLVAVSNVSSLLLARAPGRSREFAIRTAVGAGRGRLVRQVVVESLLLSACGGIAGIVFGGWAAALLAGVRPPGDLPVRFDFSLDGRVLSFGFLLTVFTGLAVGIVPALRTSRIDPDRILRASRQSGGLPPQRARVRSLLVIGEIAICFVLLSSAIVCVRSLRYAERIDPGFRPDAVLNVQMDVGQLDYDEPRGRAFFDDIERRIADLPGVSRVSFAFSVPMGYVSTGDRIAAEGQPVGPGDRVFVRKNLVGPGYFDTMDIAIVRGRAFAEDDRSGSRPVGIVNQVLAERLWPSVDPIGRRFSTSDAGPWIEVVGVARTGKYRSLLEEPAPYFYLPIAQHYTGLRALHIRTSGRPDALATAVEQIIHEREPDLPLYDVQSMRDALGGGYGLFLVRAGAMGAGLTALLGLAIAAVGVFGVVSQLTGQRTREIGVRRALGATSGDIGRLVIGEASVLIGAGLAAGLVLALASIRLIEAIAVGVPATDPLTFVAVGGMLGVVALVACAVPAWSATRVDPCVTLRSE
jgi:predicted permease